MQAKDYLKPVQSSLRNNKKQQQEIIYIFPHYQKQLWSQKSQILQNTIKSPPNSFPGLINSLFSKKNNNSQQQQQPEFKNLKTLLQHKLNNNQKNQFLDTFIPQLCSLALQIETLFPKEKKDQYPILVQNKPQKIEFTRLQIACILSHYFLDFIEDQAQLYETYNINLNMPYRPSFYNLMQQNNRKNTQMVEKLFCVYTYLEYILSIIQNKNGNTAFLAEIITFERLILEDQNLKINFQQQKNNKILNKNMTNLEFDDKKNMELYSQEGVLVDFANKYIGGGALNTGCVQEEIMFAVQPELFVTCAFTEVLQDNEALYMSGTRQYIDFQGYASTFQCMGLIQTKIDNQQQQFQDKNNNNHQNYEQFPLHKIIAIDAINYRITQSNQFQNGNIQRELEKCLAGFQGVKLSDQNENNLPIVTGNWGCGAFEGNVQLKFMIQWMACSILDRQMIYCSFQNPMLPKTPELVKHISQKQIKIYQILELVNQFSIGAATQSNKQNFQNQELFNFILNFNN